jgi:hypothetical protein
MKYIIYRISIADYIYIGSTKDFKQRQKHHKQDSKTSDFKLYQIIREQGGWDNCEMVPIEEYECDEMIQSRIREEYWRREYDANMNSIKSHQTQEELQEYKNKHQKNYYQNNKKEISEKAKEYRQIHNEQIKEYYKLNKDKINEKHICECGGSYSLKNKSTHLKSKRHTTYLETFCKE